MSKKLYDSVLRMFNPGKILAIVSVFSGIAFQAGAIPVTVQETGMGAHETVTMTSSTLGTHSVYAGVIDLLVNGVATDGFCIDPFHWSVKGPQPYNTEPLASGPKSPVNGMGTASALQIEQLWGHYYSHGMGDQNAAGLQIAIWELVGGANFHLDSGNDYGAGVMLAWVIAHPTAPAANLIAVTGPGQDYVIPCTVPDGGQTALLLGAGLAGLVLVRSKFAKTRAS